MPNRIIREAICLDGNIDKLTSQAEAFFYRLAVQCDDITHSIPRDHEVIRLRCYPLALWRVSTEDISIWLSNLARVGLITIGHDTVSLSANAMNLLYLNHDSWQKVSKQLTPIVKRRDDNKCRNCGATSDLTIDHIIPLVAGGTNTLDNLQVLCRRCNSKKGKQ